MIDLIQKALTQIKRTDNIFISDNGMLYEDDIKLSFLFCSNITNKTTLDFVSFTEDGFFFLYDEIEALFIYKSKERKIVFCGAKERSLQIVLDEEENYSFYSGSCCFIKFQEDGFILECVEEIDHIIPDYIQEITEEEVLYLKLQEII